LNLLVWIWFGLMSAGFLPLCLLASQVPGPAAVHVVLYVFIIGVLWWGAFGYGMYLSMAGMGGGDKRLLKRGIRGTARILAVKGTNTYINGQSDFGYAGRRVYRYTLQVELPGRQPYETYVSVASHQFQEGQTVQVAAAPHNRKRVAIDAAASAQQTRGTATRWHAATPQDAVPQQSRRGTAGHGDSGHRSSGHGNGGQGNGGHGNGGHGDESERLRQLSELGRLRKEGVLSDEEFATEKARILGFSS
jgi:hypothetical protein